jgi:hypothetical protein
LSIAGASDATGSSELSVRLGTGGIGPAVAFAETDGGRGSVLLAGDGNAIVRFIGTGLTLVPGRHPRVSGAVARIARISTIGTTFRTSLVVTTKGGDGAVNVDGLTTDGAIKTLSLGPTRFTGILTVAGTVQSVTLGVVSVATLNFGGDPSDGIALALELASAHNVSISSGMSIKSIKATEFLSSGTPDTIIAPSIGTISTRGAFQESLDTVDGTKRDLGDIKSLQIGGGLRGDISCGSLASLSAGSLDGAVINVLGSFPIHNIAVCGAITNTTIGTNGSIDSITADSIVSTQIDSCTVLSSSSPFLPTEPDPFVTLDARIGALTAVTGVNGLIVAAPSIGKLSLGRVATGNLSPSGVVATTIDSLAGVAVEREGTPGVPFRFKRLDEQAAYEAKVRAAGIPVGSFKVDLF